MDVMNSVPQALMERIQRLPNPHGDAEGSPLGIRLLRDYFREVSALASDLPHWHGGPFFDPAKVLGLNLDEAAINVTAELQRKLRIDSALVKRACVDAFRWQLYIEAGNAMARKHANVFEPLIQLFELGCPVSIHHGDVLVGGLAVPLTTWRWDYLEKTCIAFSELKNVRD